MGTVDEFDFELPYSRFKRERMVNASKVESVIISKLNRFN